MDGVKSEKQRDAQPRLFDGFPLKAVAQRWRDFVIYERSRPGRHLLYLLAEIVGIVVAPQGVLGQLKDFLFQGHTPQKIRDARLYGSVRIFVQLGESRLG